MVVVSYDTEDVPYHDLAYKVVHRVRPLFDGKENFEVHLAGGAIANDILLRLADRKVGK